MGADVPAGSDRGEPWPPLFWGAFDLAVTRFSGRTAPRHPRSTYEAAADLAGWERERLESSGRPPGG